MKVAIIEDKQQVREYLEILIKNHPELDYIGYAYKVKEAIHLISDKKPDLVLFDVQLIDGTSFDVLAKLENKKFKAIFITDHHGYAINAFRYNAIDYILKPIDSDIFNEAIKRSLKLTKLENQESQIDILLKNINSQHQKNEKIILNTLSEMHVVSIDSIIRCESEDSYTYFYLNDGKSILVAKQLKEYETLLSSHSFTRIHRSHLINLNHLSSYNKKNSQIVMSDGKPVPISSRKKDLLKNELTKLNII